MDGQTFHCISHASTWPCREAAKETNAKEASDRARRTQTLSSSIETLTRERDEAREQLSTATGSASSLSRETDQRQGELQDLKQTQAQNLQGTERKLAAATRKADEGQKTVDALMQQLKEAAAERKQLSAARDEQRKRAESAQESHAAAVAEADNLRSVQLPRLSGWPGLAILMRAPGLFTNALHASSMALD